MSLSSPTHKECDRLTHNNDHYLQNTRWGNFLCSFTWYQCQGLKSWRNSRKSGFKILPWVSMMTISLRCIFGFYSKLHHVYLLGCINPVPNLTFLHQTWIHEQGVFCWLMISVCWLFDTNFLTLFSPTN